MAYNETISVNLDTFDAEKVGHKKRKADLSVM